MQHPILQAYGLTFSIIAEQTAEGWRALVLIPSKQQCGRLCWDCLISSPIPGLHESEVEACRVAHLFAVVNASGDRMALAELNWRFWSWLLSGLSG